MIDDNIDVECSNDTHSASRQSTDPFAGDRKLVLFCKESLSQSPAVSNSDCLVTGEFFRQFSPLQVQSSFHKYYPKFKVLYEQMFANSKPRSYFGSLQLAKRPPEAHLNQQKSEIESQCHFRVPDSRLNETNRIMDKSTPAPEKRRSKADPSEADKEDILDHMLNANRRYQPITKAEILSVNSGSIEVYNSAGKQSFLDTTPRESVYKSIKRPTLDSTEGWTTGCLGFWMIESNELVVPTSRSLTFTDKVYFSNLVNLRHKDKFVDSSLDRHDFIEAIKINMGYPTERRCDEELRWIFKRVLKIMLRKYTVYQPIKNYRRDIYIGEITQMFFPNNVVIARELFNSTFASRKKVKRLFDESERFKDEFLWYVNNMLEDEYYSELTRKYDHLFNMVCIGLEKNSEAKHETILRKFRKRLDWTVADVTDAKNLINEMVDPYTA